MADEPSRYTLTDITYLGRQGVKLTAVILVLLIVGRTTLELFAGYWRATHPAPPPPPTVGFGLLPTIEFPPPADNQPPASPSQLVLETATGGLPEFSDRAKVFFMPSSQLGLFDEERAQRIAANLGFTKGPHKTGTRIFRWTKSSPLTATFQLDIQSLEFSITTDFLERPELLSNDLPSSRQAVERVKSLIASVQPLPEDLVQAPAEVTLLESLGTGDLQPAIAPVYADFYQVDINRTPIDDQFKVYTPVASRGIVHAVVAGGLGSSDSVVLLEFEYRPVDYTQVHTYPLRSVQTAWRQLQTGAGYIASPPDTNQSRVVVREVELGYYDDFADQSYLQPIYVFVGDGGFLGYVSAIDPKALQ
ncbi:MAG: hypothetical protein COU69_00385 [Candidatus Pacebacteria bacterium CG10_big_fil_rev_8_21_14_0_10_56_10]|nr:MAG: hypothetical protein COU69_00385 [Candidatus Pacebacteria bacterium CG10_big_fil_rev_8_21_14_0_10_56_10]